MLELIGYLRLNLYRDNTYYNFDPILKKVGGTWEKQNEWIQDAMSFFFSVPQGITVPDRNQAGNLYDRQVTFEELAADRFSHHEVCHVCYDYEGASPEPISRYQRRRGGNDAKLFIRSSEDLDEKLRPISMERSGFFPVLTIDDQGIVQESITRTPRREAAFNDNDPAYIPEDSYVLVRNDGIYYQVPANQMEELGDGEPVYRIPDLGEVRVTVTCDPWEIFSDIPNSPQYVYISNGDIQDNTAPEESEDVTEQPVDTQPPAGPAPDSHDEEETPPQVEYLTPEELTTRLVEEIQKYRPDYSKNDILGIAIAITQNFLTVFSGAPGCGKTSICNIFAHVLGLNDPDNARTRYVPVSVERGWTSKRDLIGYHNPLLADPGNPNNPERDTIIAANPLLYKALGKASEEYGVEKDVPPLLILLDEANLSAMEFYWSDFMSIAGGDAEEVDRSINLGGPNGELKIPESCHFVATINNDDTTEKLSPRIIDRAAFIVLPSPKDNPDEENGQMSLYRQSETVFSDNPPPVSWKSLQNAFDSTSMDRIYDAFCASGNACTIYKKLKYKLMKSDEQTDKPLRMDISFRTEKAILRFWYAAKENFEAADDVSPEIIALDHAVAQRLLPKLEGYGKPFADALDTLRAFCAENKLNQCVKILEQIKQRGGTDESVLNHYAFF